MANSPSRYLQLHLLVLVLASTAILGRLIQLPAPSLVFWRTFLAALVLALWLLASRRAPLRIRLSDQLKMAGIGIILGLHWMTFFGSIQLSNVSICLAGMASTSLFTAFSEPLLNQRRPCLKEILLGLLVIPGLAMIAGSSWNHASGLACALVSAFLASLFPVLNRKLILQGHAAPTMTFYELAAASLTCFITIGLFGNPRLPQLPSPADLFWLLVLSVICTVWAFSFHIHLLRYFSAFTSNLAINFEPVYGILLAAVIFHEYRDLHPAFYFGSTLIVAANMAHACILRKQKHKNQTTKP